MLAKVDKLLCLPPIAKRFLSEQHGFFSKACVVQTSGSKVSTASRVALLLAHAHKHAHTHTETNSHRQKQTETDRQRQNRHTHTHTKQKASMMFHTENRAHAAACQRVSRATKAERSSRHIECRHQSHHYPPLLIYSRPRVPECSASQASCGLEKA